MATLRQQLEEAMRMGGRSRTRDRLSDSAMLISGAAIGALATYVFDGVSGRRRRAMARDKALHFAKRLQWFAGRRAQDLRNRAVGSFAEMRSQMRDAERRFDDQVLEARVRAQLGHATSHSGALEVRVEEGCAVISGPVLIGERDKIADRLRKTRGIRDVDMRVTEHASKEGIPGLQGESRAEHRGIA